MESREYFICGFKYLKQEYFLIWYCADIDGVVVDSSKKTITSMSLSKIKEQPFKFESDDVELFDCDFALVATQKDNFTVESANIIINIVNMCGDIAKSIYGKHNSYEDLIISNKDIYDKIFYTCNLPSINNSSRKYLPEWSKNERDILYKLINDGINIFMNNRVDL